MVHNDMSISDIRGAFCDDALYKLTFTFTYRSVGHPYIHVATSEMWHWSGGRGMPRKLSLCYSNCVLL